MMKISFDLSLLDRAQTVLFYTNSAKAKSAKAPHSKQGIAVQIYGTQSDI